MHKLSEIFLCRIPTCITSKRAFSKSQPGLYNSAITKPVVSARIMVEMGSHLTKRVPVKSHNSFSTKGLEKSLCDFTGPFLYSVRTRCILLAIPYNNATLMSSQTKARVGLPSASATKKQGWTKILPFNTGGVCKCPLYSFPVVDVVEAEQNIVRKSYSSHKCLHLTKTTCSTYLVRTWICYTLSGCHRTPRCPPPAPTLLHTRPSPSATAALPKMTLVHLRIFETMR